MLWLLILLLIVLVVLGYLLLAPFYFEVDSTSGLCRVRFHRMASAGLVIDGSSLKINVVVAWWKKQIDIGGKAMPKPQPKEKPIPVKTAKKKKPFTFSVGFVKAVARTFKVNKCYLNIDTGDMPLNGILFPCFYWLETVTGKTFRINFEDKNEIKLEIENNLARILKVFIIQFFIIKKQKHGQFK